MISALKNAGADVNYLGGSTWSAADHCIAYENVEGFKALVNAGANLKQVWNGMTVIEYAAYTKNKNLILKKIIRIPLATQKKEKKSTLFQRKIHGSILQIILEN